MRYLLRSTASLLLAASGVVVTYAQAHNLPANRPRVVITADPELDDKNTLIRAVLYTTDFELEGLVYVSSVYHWRGDGKGTTQIKRNWPDVQNGQLAMINYGYFIRNGLAQENQVYLSGAGTRENVLGRSPLGALYRVWGDGKKMVADDPSDFFGLTGHNTEQLRTLGYAPFAPPQEKDSFISEGDTPTFLNLLNAS